MNYLPLFFELKQRTVLVVGGGDVAARKISLLRQAGAYVQVVAQKLNVELAELHQNAEIQWIEQQFMPTQLDSVFLVIAATDDSQLNQRVFHAAEERQRWVNVVDDRAQCSFIFPSIIDRSPLMVAVSSAGEAPVLARLIREKLEAVLPQSLGKMAEVAGKWRSRIKQTFTSITERRRFWEQAFTGRFAALMAAGNIAQAEQQLATQLENHRQHSGEVTLVGAGPGDAGLLTLKALQAMQQADVVLYDHLVSDEVLNLVRRDASKICVGKRAANHSVAQEAINQQLVTLAQQGKRVVRLKGGDPFIFGRGGEELAELAKLGIPYQVVPGITAAAGATAYAGIPLTHRDYSQSVLFITGHCRAEADALDWASLARSRQTLAIYMGTVKAAEIQQHLIAHGRSAETPVAAIGRGTRPDQQVVTGTLAQLAQLAVQVPAPALLVIGEVVALHHQLAWFGAQSENEKAVQHSIVDLV